MPVGKLKEILTELWEGDPIDFFKRGISAPSSWQDVFYGFFQCNKNSKGGNYYRSFIADQLFYNSKLYRSENGGRGRLGVLNAQRYDQFGLLLANQQEYNDFPKHQSQWIPDCKGQKPRLDSHYVRDLIENDAVYVSGPSGMTSLLLGQMEFMANLEDLKLKQSYLLAVVSYIVGAGIHSLHEVIGPAEYVLNLVPGYKIAPPTEQIAPPPNFHIFFAQQSVIDTEFTHKRETAWCNYLNFFNRNYAPKNIPAYQILSSIITPSKTLDMQKEPLRSKTLTP